MLSELNCSSCTQHIGYVEKVSPLPLIYCDRCMYTREQLARFLGVTICSEIDNYYTHPKQDKELRLQGMNLAYFMSIFTIWHKSLDNFVITSYDKSAKEEVND